MSHLRRARLGGFSGDHDRARRLTIERLAEPLGADDSVWLEGHLDRCAGCAVAAAGYAEDAFRLRSARAAHPPVPRDLWARTAARLDREAGRRRAVARTRRATGGHGPSPLVPVGLLAGALVVGVVVGSTILSGGDALPSPPASTPMPSVAVVPTPLPVAAANVAWVEPAADGSYLLTVAGVTDVCPPAEPCPPVAGGTQVLRLASAPRALIRAADGRALAVVDATVDGTSGTVHLVLLDGRSPLAPDASAATTSSPSSASPGSVPLVEVETPAPAMASPSPEASGSASTGPAPTASASAPASAPAEPSASASPRASASPSGSPVVLEIATGLVVVDDAMAFSPDGRSFAFTARPAEASTGSDIYVWSVGDEAARPVTVDGRSVFGSWIGMLLLGSRAEPVPAVPAEPAATDGTDGTDASTGAGAVDGTTGTGDGSAGTAEATATPPPEPTARPVAFFLDPTGGRIDDIGVGIWRPVVDPGARWLVFWSGRLRLDAATGRWLPLDGDLRIASWPDLLGDWTGPSATDGTDASGGTDATAGVDASGGSTGPGRPLPVMGTGGPDARPPLSWEVVWDPAGDHLAIRLGDPVDLALGLLSCFTIDPWSGSIDPARALLRDEPALGGISLEDGRLAWATPPGQDGQGSRLRVLAWGGWGIGEIGGEPVGSSGSVVVVR